MSTDGTPALRVAEDGEALRAAIREAPEGAVVLLGPGRYLGPVVLRRSVTLRSEAGAGQTILDAQGQGAVLTVQGRGSVVQLEGLTLTGGRSRLGGGLLVPNGADLSAVDCVLLGCEATGDGGGGLCARRGTLRLRGVRFAGNTGRVGGAALLLNDVQAHFEDCTFADNQAAHAGRDLALRDRVQVTLVGCGFEPQGASSRAVHAALVPGAIGPEIRDCRGLD